MSARTPPHLAQHTHVMTLTMFRRLQRASNAHGEEVRHKELRQCHLGCRKHTVNLTGPKVEFSTLIKRAVNPFETK